MLNGDCISVYLVIVAVNSCEFTAAYICGFWAATILTFRAPETCLYKRSWPVLHIKTSLHMLFEIRGVF